MLKGVVGLVTGSASGLGRATAQHLVRQGGRVVCCDLPTSAGAQEAQELGNSAIFVPTDVVSTPDVENALSECRKHFGRLDVTVNCASIALAFQIFGKAKRISHSLEDFSKIMMVNTVGTFNVGRLSAAVMAENTPDSDGQRGLIINTSSYAAEDGQPGQAAFSASKAAVQAMTLPMARDLAAVGIRVCTISPGLFRTPLVVSAIPEDIQEFLTENVLCPRRLGEPEEFAMMVQSVITNPMLNGETIRLNGGMRLNLMM